MKILYIAPVRDFSGYANAARGYIRALYQAGADIAVRAIRYDKADPGSMYEPTDIENKLLKRDLKNIDIVIQHTTPNEMRPMDDKVNIAIVAWETTRIPPYWVNKLNKFDAVMTFCDASVEAFQNCGVYVPIHKIPHTFEIADYDLNGIEPITIPKLPDYFKDRFVFLNISQFATKKGIDVLLRAYYGAFHGQEDDVLLILKTYIGMANRQQEREKIQQYIESVKAGMRLPNNSYPPVMLITNTLTDEYIQRLHATSDCYVCSSRAEGWCIPAFEALAYGKKLVTTTWGGMGEFACDVDYFEVPEDQTNMIPGKYRVGERAKSNVFPVQYSIEPLVGQNHGDPELYTALDNIAEPSVTSMMQAMKNAREQSLVEKADLMEFDYSKVGPEMLKIIQSYKIQREEIKRGLAEDKQLVEEVFGEQEEVTDV